MLPKTMMYLVVQNAIEYAKDTLHRNILQNILLRHMTRSHLWPLIGS